MVFFININLRKFPENVEESIAYHIKCSNEEIGVWNNDEWIM